MSKNDTKIKRVRHRSTLPRKKKVAAYARVSTGKEAMLHSLSAQVSYYSNLIQNKRGWLYMGVYVDEAMTGTSKERPSFLKMMNDARAGKLDMIITKSISRFARNTVTLLETIRELKALNVDVYFEEQRIHSLSADGELVLTFLASYAQEESRSASENLKWSIRNRFKKGLAWNTYVYGYQFSNGTFKVIKEEAEIVKEIFASYLGGEGTLAIAKKLNERGVLTKPNNKWRHNSIQIILRNYLYTGNSLLQTTYKDNHLTKRKVINNGVLPKYHVENSHEPIIDIDTFNKVQHLIAEKQKNTKVRTARDEKTLYRGMLVCDKCGKDYNRRITKNKAYWICSTYNFYGKESCPSKQIPEDILNEIVKSTLNLSSLNYETVNERLTNIIVQDKQVKLSLKTGQEVTVPWAYQSRSASWTPEMREKARQKAMKGRNKNEKDNSNTTNN